MGSKIVELSSQELEGLLVILRTRFEENLMRHQKIDWNEVNSKIIANKEKQLALYLMEISGGEPDVISYDDINGDYLFFDCSAESPKGRRSVCYDRKALEERKENKPHDSAEGMAYNMGIEILDEEQYRELQKLGSFDTKTSSWIKTPDHIRKLGGAIFCDCRYETVFVYHNSAESYYASRGFRGSLKV